MSSNAHKKLKLRLWKLYGDRCWYCGDPMTMESATVEHLIPHSRSGPTSEENCVLTHQPCNEAMADIPLALKIEWRAMIRRSTDSRVLNKYSPSDEKKFSEVHLFDAYQAGLAAGKRSPSSHWKDALRSGEAYIIALRHTPKLFDNDSEKE